LDEPVFSEQILNAPEDAIRGRAPETACGGDTVAMIHALGAKLVKVRKAGDTRPDGLISKGKDPIGAGWRAGHEIDQVLDHLLAGGNAGLLCGEVSGLYQLDIDRERADWESAHPEFKDYPRFTRANAPDRAKYLLHLKPGQASGIKRFKDNPGRKADLLGNGAQGVIAGVHESQAVIEFENAVCDLEDVPEIDLNQLLIWLDEWHYTDFARPEKQGHTPPLIASSGAGADQRSAKQDQTLVEAAIAHFKATHSMADVLSHATARTSGRYIALRPDDKTPSMFVNSDNATCMDFGIGEYLDVFEVFCRTSGKSKRDCIWQDAVPAYLSAKGAQL
jgi:hypothetical protein